MGRPIEEYSKAELIEIIGHLANKLRQQSERHAEEMEVLIG
jgi:hypothetical protein